MSALRRILDALIPGSPARAAQPNRVAQIGSAGRMNPNNTKLGAARAQLQPKQPLPYKLPGGGTSQFNPNSVINAGNLTPQYEDGYDTTIKYMQGNMQRGRMPMGSIPTNNTYARTGYYQGSNPLGNVPERNIYQNISPFDEDTILRGNQIQSPSLDRYFNRY